MAMNWHSTDDKPLIIPAWAGRWVTTEDGDKDFMAAVPTNKGWWVRHCIIDGGRLCLVQDEGPEPAPWEIEDVEYWAEVTLPVTEKSNQP
jgi:hypothetical protein